MPATAGPRLRAADARQGSRVPESRSRYRRARVPKGHISINAEEGFAFLRGVLDRQEDIERIEVATRQIEGVREVENLIHLPGTPAPASQPKSERSGHASR